MAATYDSTAYGNSVGATTSVSFNITVAANSDRAVAVGLSFGDAAAVTNIAVTVGGVSATLVSGTDSGGSLTSRSLLYVVTQTQGLGTGSLAVSATWTTNDNCIAGAVSAYNVDQTTPMNNGTFAVDFGGGDATAEVSITSASGDLTMSVVADKSGNAPVSTDKTVRWDDAPSSAIGGGGDTGTGAGTQTHTWTLSATGHSWTLSGANFKASAGATVLTPSAGGGVFTGTTAILGKAILMPTEF